MKSHCFAEDRSSQLLSLEKADGNIQAVGNPADRACTQSEERQVPHLFATVYKTVT